MADRVKAHVQQPVGQIGQQLVAQIPWGHNILVREYESGNAIWKRLLKKWKEY